MSVNAYKPFYLRSYHSKLVLTANNDSNQPIYQARKEGSINQVWFIDNEKHMINAGTRCMLCYDNSKHLIITKDLYEDSVGKEHLSSADAPDNKEESSVPPKSETADSLDLDLDNLDLDGSLQNNHIEEYNDDKKNTNEISNESGNVQDSDEIVPIIWSFQSSTIPQAILLETNNVFDQPTLLYLLQSSKKSGKFVSLKPYQEKNILAGQLWQIREIIPQLFQLNYVPYGTWVTPKEPVYHNSVLGAQNDSKSTLFIAVQHQGPPQGEQQGYNIIHLNSGLFITIYNEELLLTQIKEEASEFLFVPSKEAENTPEGEDILCTIQPANQELAYAIESGDLDSDGDIIHLHWVQLDK